MKFFQCPDCGKILIPDRSEDFEPKKLTELVPNTTDAAGEKHVPVIRVNGNLVKVEVGAVAHPMLDAHYITFIVLETSQGYQKKDLKPGDKPEAVFALADGAIVLLREREDALTTFELKYMASLTGAHVASAEDLIVMDNKIYFRSPGGGFQRVSIIHRMLMDQMLDPLCFDEKSTSGVPHLMEVYAAGNVAILNAPGCGLAEDRGLYAFIPAMIRYYLDEEPLLPNVPTYLPWYPDQRDYILSHMDRLFFKDVAGDRRTAAIRGTILSPNQRRQLAAAIEADPRRFMAQEILDVEKVPVYTSGGETVPARCDFRAYTVHSDSIRVWMGGLSRFTVHHPDGSATVGFKDTWVMAE